MLTNLAQADLFAPPEAAKPLPPGSAVAAIAPPRPPAPQNTLHKQWLCLHLAQLPLEVFPHFEPEDAVVVTQAAGPRVLVACVSQAAASQGVRASMTASAAQGLVPGLQLCPRDERTEQRRLQWLARWASRFSSWVSVEPQNTLYLEVAGSARLFGDARELQRSLRAGLGAHGHSAQSAVAPTPRGALWLALHNTDAHPCIDKPEHLPGAISALPTAVLDLPPQRAHRLTRAGLRTLGDLLRMPRDGLARRYGQNLLQQLDQALGKAPQALPAFAPPQRFTANVDLPLPSAAVPRILPAAEHGLKQLCEHLRAHDRAVDRYICLLFHEGRPATRCAVGLRTASRSLPRLLQLLGEHLERQALHAEVVGLRIEAPKLLPLAVNNRDWITPPGDDDWLATVERWQARLGDDAVRRLGTHADHRPERASTVNATDAGCWPQSLRPLYLLPKPSPLQVHNDLPIYGGPLTRLHGPERIEQGWWDGTDISRDYYILRDTRGARLWAYQDRRRLGWWLQGVFA